MAVSRPLAGRRIVVTRAVAQAGTFVRLLEDAGAEVIATPTISIDPPETWEPLDAAIRTLDAFRWVIFTSVNGVTMMGERLLHHGMPWSALSNLRVAAIGPATAAALRASGLQVEIVPEEYRAESLAERLRTGVRPGDGVLLPRAADTRDTLVRKLRALGVRVVEVPVYRTRPVLDRAGALRAAIGRGAIDVVTFTSSSTARNFAALFSSEERRRLFANVTIASIGPITAETAASFGFVTRIMPREYTIAALAEAIAGYFANGTERS
jgi:uroporphyrinogen III methyltransferase/synthase